MDDAFTRPVQEILKHFQVSENRGLPAKAVEAQRKKFGPNGGLFKKKALGTDIY
jgi:hypothetical protein